MYWAPWSPWKMVAARLPRSADAVVRASLISCEEMWSAMDQPTSRRLMHSIAVVR
jgi:hypothetical protein